MMRSRRSISRSRWLTAIVCSLAIHVAFAGTWIRVRPAGQGVAEVRDTLVEGPGDDRETTIFLKDPPIRLIPKVVANTPKKDPAAIPLPKTISGDQGGNPEIKPVSGSSPEKGIASANGDGIPKLHGKVKPGKTVVYLLDCSSSMGADLRRAKATVRESMRHLGPESKFQVVSYNGGATGCFPTACLPEAGHLEKAEAWLNTLVAEGRSDHLKGFREALSVRPDAIFLLTDADDLDEKEVKAILAITPPGVFVNAAIFGPGAGITTITPLEYLTRRHNGSIRWYPGR